MVGRGGKLEIIFPVGEEKKRMEREKWKKIGERERERVDRIPGTKKARRELSIIM